MSLQRPPHQVSVKDVAARSGVSFQTTSKVLNGKGSVSAATRTRILQAARELGYVPNLQARSLVMRRTHTIGLIASDLSDPSLSRFVVGAEQEARRHGYGLLVTLIEPEASGSEYALPAMMERRVDGILLAAPQTEDDLALAHVLDSALPAVSLYPVPGDAVPTVASDDEASGVIATRHLFQTGHRIIATITGARTKHATDDRLRGYRRALEESGIASDPGLIEQGGGDVEGGRAATKRLLQRDPRITAIFAQNDAMAIGAMKALAALGKRIPEDCAVVGCDDTDIAAYTTPPLTSVHVPFYEAGMESMRLLLSMISNGSANGQGTVLPVRLIARGSS